MTEKRRLLGCAAVLVAVWAAAAALLASCSKNGGGGSSGSSRTFPLLDAAATARLNALSSGWVTGSAETAASLSAGELAARDQAAARAQAAQQAGGDTTDYGFDIISVAAHPLNGGASDFVAFEKVRFHDTGAARNFVELYHRDNGGAPWKAVDRVYLADNIGVPSLRVDSAGAGHLLSADEMTARSAKPEDLATKYATAVSVQGDSGRLPAGAFQPGQFTTGEITEIVDYASGAAGSGSFSRRWQARPGGQAVELSDGILVFGHLQRVQERHEYSFGSTHYFSTQDPKRLNYGGLLAPGKYSDLTFTSTVTVAAIVKPQALPDVVGRDEQTIAAQGQMTQGQ